MLLSAQCPQCGRPAPASLASPGVLRCPACRYTGPMPPQAAQSLHAAAQLLHHTNVRERQLTQAQQKAISDAGSQTAIFFAVLGVSSLPALCAAFAQVLVTVEQEGDEIAGGLMLILPFFVVVGMGLFMYSRVRQRRMAMMAACSASPPASPGEPCTCHVCGGPLQSAPARQAVVRCGFCAADNVVAAATLARAAQHRQVVVGDYEANLRSELAKVSAFTTRATLYSFAGALLLPPATVVLLVLIIFPIVLITGPADLTVTYTHELLARGDCVGKARPLRKGGWKIHRPLAAGKGEASYVDVMTLNRPFHVDALVGQDMVTEKGDKVRVTSVESDRITGNHVRFPPPGKPDAHKESTSPENLCFAPR